ncbi:THAP domain-containing protein 5-like [Ixodes scapularis]|uniref:THAP domain-containing protein 5-like n=1 Tax=Ixodes scapularis TaxID=6945 RepID=UPI001C386B08|nr:THAP domain-containing protein 5-like [Ixodes scapularis]
MPLHCCVPLCKQRGVKDNNGNKVSFFAFPKEPTVRKKWVIAIKRDEGKLFTITKYTKVCSLHFQEKDYLINIASGFRFLKERVAPSVFGFNAAKKPPRRAPLQRVQATSKLTAADEDATDSY